MAEVAASTLSDPKVEDTQHTDRRDLFLEVTVDVTDVLLSYLSEKDLCSIALCSRGWRERANSNRLWRRLCKVRGWERFGTTVDLNLENALCEKNKNVARIILTKDNAETLEPTCTWKVTFMKAWHLESCWQNAKRDCHAERIHMEHDEPWSWLESDGCYVVRAYIYGVGIDHLNGSFGEEEEQDEDDSEYKDEEARDHWSLLWGNETIRDIGRCLVSKGIGLVAAYASSDPKGHSGKYFFSTFDCQSLKWLVSVRVDVDQFNCLCLDGETVISRGSKAVGSNYLVVWSSIDGRRLHTFKGHFKAINDLSLNDDLALSAAENLKLWDVKKGECLKIFDCPGESPEFEVCSLNGSRLMGGFDWTSACFWDITSDNPPVRINGCYLGELRFSEFAVGHADLMTGRWKVWDQYGEIVFVSDDTEELYAQGIAVIGTKVLVLGYDTLNVWKLQRAGLQHLDSITVDDVEWILWVDDTKIVSASLPIEGYDVHTFW